MKRINSILFCFVLLAAFSKGPLYAQSYEACGAKPGLLTRLFTEAEKMRLKCIEDAYQENKKKTEEEIQLIQAELASLEVELKKVAYQVNYNIVHCESRDKSIPRNAKRVEQCQEIVKAKSILIDRLRELTEWVEKPKKHTDTKTASEGIAPTCPSKEKLQEIKKIRYFNKKLYQTWERCAYLDPENFN